MFVCNQCCKILTENFGTLFVFFVFCFVLFEIACERGYLSLDRSHSKCLRATCARSYHLDHTELTSKARLCKSQALLFPKKLLVMSGGSFVVSEDRDQRRAKPPSGHPAALPQQQRKIRPNLLTEATGPWEQVGTQGQVVRAMPLQTLPLELGPRLRLGRLPGASVRPSWCFVIWHGLHPEALR